MSVSDRGVSVDEIARRGGRYVAPSDGAVMILVPEGEFFFGRDPSDIFAPPDEIPGGVVRLRPFLIDRDPVTNERFARFVEAGGYDEPACWSPEGWEWRGRSRALRPLSFTTKGFDAPEQPVAGVCWYEADAYARWAGKNLPTEAQWEKAARGPDGRRFPWGDALPRSALLNFNSNVGRTTPPGAYPLGASPYGLFDMSGNVNNWCRDWYWSRFHEYLRRAGIARDPGLDTPEKERLGLDLRMKSDRGGGFATSFACWEVLTTTGRLAWPPERRQIWHGFRCVIEL